MTWDEKLKEWSAAIKRYNDKSVSAADIVMLLSAVPEAIARIRELQAALERIAAGNPATAGKWLSDIEMASIARAALGRP